MAHKTIGKLVDEAATLLQRIVRMKAAVHSGSEFIQCVSCGKSGSWKEMQGGHFVPRGSAGTKLLEENIHPQCRQCNGPRGGNLIGYTVFMIDTYGPEFIKELNRMKRAGHKWVRADLVEMISELKQREKELEAQL